MTKIYATKEMRLALEEHFQCSASSISLALNCKRDSPLARKIRAYAVNQLNATPLT